MENFDWLKGFVFPYINFALFLFLAIKLFRKPLLDMVQGRRREFDRLLAEAQEAKLKAEAQHAELSLRLAGLDAEIASKLSQAKADATSEAASLTRKANELSLRLQEEAKRLAEAEIIVAKDQLRAEIIREVKLQLIDRFAKLGENEHKLLLKTQLKAAVEAIPQ